MRYKLAELGCSSSLRENSVLASSCAEGLIFFWLTTHTAVPKWSHEFSVRPRRLVSWEDN